MTERKSWAARLETAKERGKFFALDKRLSDQWNSCAIGERHNFDPGIWSPDLEEAELNLGLQFNDAVQGDNVAEAIEVYQQILALPPVV